MAMDYFNPRVIDGTGMILDTTPGSPDTGSYVTEDQLKNWIKAGILFDGYYYNGNFYSDSGHTSPLAKVEGAMYVDKTNANKALYVCLSSTYQSLTEEAQVQAIIDGLNDGTIVPLKAKQDQNGNVIDLTYETKADANDLKNALQATNARVTNLEQKAGDYATVQYRGTNAVPTGKAKYAMVETIVGKSRGWNQLCQSLDTISQYKCSRSAFSSGVATITGFDGTSAQTYMTGSLIVGHEYLTFVQLNPSKATRVAVNYGSMGTQVDVTANTWYTHTFKGTASGTDFGFYYNRNNDLSSSDTIQVKNMLFRDLTLIFGSGNEPSTVAEAVALCPSILEYDAYGYSLVDTVVEGVESVGVNIVDGVFELGSLNVADGSETSSTSVIRTKNYLEVSPNTSYYFLMPSAIQSDGLYVFWYDAEKNWIRTNLRNTANGFEGTSPTNGAYLRFFLPSSYGTTYNNNVQICLNSYADKTTFHPYMTDTLSLPSPVTLRSAGSGVNEVRDGINPETGVPTENVGTVVLSTLTWTWDGYYWKTTFTDGVPAPDGNSLASITHPLYEVRKSTGFSSTGDNGICYAPSSPAELRVKTTSSSVQPSGILNYVKATPTTGTSIGTSNPMIQTEGGGTINTIQTQTTKIDNCLDVGYLAV